MCRGVWRPGMSYKEETDRVRKGPGKETIKIGTGLRDTTPQDPQLEITR